MLLGMGTFSLIAPAKKFSFGKSSKEPLPATGMVSTISDKEVESDITALVKKYFEAKQKVDMVELAECVSDISHVEEKRLVTEAEYIEEYKNIECTILQEGLREGAYRVYAYYEAKIYDIDTLVPSLTALYVTSDTNGQLMIYLSAIQSDDQEAIEALDNSDDVRKMITSVQNELQDIVSKNADVRDFYQMLETSGTDTGTDDTEDNENIENEGSMASASPAAISAAPSSPKAE